MNTCAIAPFDLRYNPNRDLMEVVPFGYIDINECYRTGVVPSGANKEVEFNDVTNTECLMSRASDVFESIRQVNYVGEKFSEMTAAEKKKAEKSISQSSAESSSE